MCTNVSINFVVTKQNFTFFTIKFNLKKHTPENQKWPLYIVAKRLLDLST